MSCRLVRGSVKAVAAAFIAGVVTANVSPAATAGSRLPVKAPPPVTISSWTGCYVGANIGWGAADESYADPTVAPPAPLGSHRADGVIGGGDIGCDYQSGPWVIGIQGMFDAANLRGSHVFAAPGDVPDIFQTHIPWLASVTVRVGRTLRPDLLAYLKGGFAWKRQEEAKIDTITGPEGFANVTRTGGLFGGGLEHQFTPAWSGFVEVDYIAFGTDTINFTPVPPEVPFPLNIRENMWMIMAGVNYRFGSLRGR